MLGKEPLCCCEYIDQNGERNHILACFCNCVELDECFDRCITCRRITRKDLSSVMGLCLDRLRCPGRGGAFSPLSLSYTVIFPFVFQPVIAITCALYVHNLLVASLVILLLQALLSWYMARHNSHSDILYYWNLSAVLYTVVLFEASVTPLLEIRWDENVIVVVLSLTALGCFYLTRIFSGQNGVGDRSNGAMMNGVNAESVCPVCRIKMYPRCIHCHICHTCVPRYDHHSFWLDCCIGENNQAFFMAGLITGIMALVYGALLILTTICRPAFKYGVFVPEDCSDVTSDLELSLCYISAVNCLGLAVFSFVQLLHHVWLVSRGLSGEEWRLQKYSLCVTTPYSRGCVKNWTFLLRGVRKFRR